MIDELAGAHVLPGCGELACGHRVPRLGDLQLAEGGAGRVEALGRQLCCLKDKVAPALVVPIILSYRLPDESPTKQHSKFDARKLATSAVSLVSMPGLRFRL